MMYLAMLWLRSSWALYGSPGFVSQVTNAIAPLLLLSEKAKKILS
jgi:hypothetical protein